MAQRWGQPAPVGTQRQLLVDRRRAEAQAQRFRQD